MSSFEPSKLQKAGVVIVLFVLGFIVIEAGGIYPFFHNSITTSSTIIVRNPDLTSEPQNSSYTLIWQSSNNSTSQPFVIPQNTTNYEYYSITATTASASVYSAREEINLSAKGIISANLVDDLDSVGIAFDSAIPYFPNAVIFGNAELDLTPKYENDNINGIPVAIGNFYNLDTKQPLEMQFQSQGTYYPTVTLYYHNGTKVSHSYNEPLYVGQQIASTINKTVAVQVPAPDNIDDKVGVLIFGGAIVTFTLLATGLTGEKAREIFVKWLFNRD